MSDEKKAAAIARNLVATEQLLTLNTFDDAHNNVYGVPLYYISPDSFPNLDHNGSPIFLLPEETSIYKFIVTNGVVSLTIYDSKADDLTVAPRICILGKATELPPSNSIDDAFAETRPQVKHLIPGNPSGIKTRYLQLRIDKIWFMQKYTEFMGFISADVYSSV